MSSQKIEVWGSSLPAKGLQHDDITYFKNMNDHGRPSVEWLWQEIDNVWNALDLNNQAPFRGQKIDEFYSHPIWIVNGVFSAVDPASIQHRDTITAFISRLDIKRVADYGGGFGELALKLHTVAPKICVDIVEPYPSMIGILRVEGKRGIRYISEPDGQYDCIIAQDVLEHVEEPLELTCELVQSTKMGGHLIFANCFYPVVKCHLPATFYLRHTFIWVVRAMGLRYVQSVPDANHALVFERAGRVNNNLVKVLSMISKFVGPLLNAGYPTYAVIRHKIAKYFL